MKRKPLIITLALTSLIFYTCDYSDTKLTITNNSSKSIVIDYSEDSLLTSVNSVEYYIAKQISPREKKTVFHRGLWSNYIKNSKKKKIFFFFFDIDTLKKYNNMEFIRTHKLYTKKLGLTEKELDKINWQIEYEE